MTPQIGVWTLCREANKSSVTEFSGFRSETNPISISAMVVETR